MNLLYVAAELEDELKWRQDELRLLSNQLSVIKKTEDQDRYRKAMLVMLYAHYEGFCKAALGIYANAVNRQRIKCKDVNFQIAAACLTPVFTALTNPSRMTGGLPSTDSVDDSLKSLARRVDLLKMLDTIWDTDVKLPVDKLVNTESNLWLHVLKKILYRLGLNEAAFDNHEVEISLLLNYRNEIAHGFRERGVTASDYSKIEATTYKIMAEVKLFVYEGLRLSHFKKTA
jgi:hypothetical protein